MKIAFDKFDTDSEGLATINSAYKGLTWSEFGVVEAAVAYPDAPYGGYTTGITSGTKVAYGGRVDSSVTVDGSFDLDSIQLTSAWNAKLDVDILGYEDGVKKYQIRVRIGDHAPKSVNLQFDDVDTVVFHTSTIREDNHFPFYGKFFALDDMVVSDVKYDAAAIGSHARVAAYAFGGDAAANGHPHHDVSMHADLQHTVALA